MTDLLLNVVLIAKKNTSLSLRRALDSIREQVYRAIRVVVVDANEPNSIYSLGLQEDLADYPEAEYLQLNPLLSHAQLRNYMLSYVEGEYIAFINSNDKWDSIKSMLQMNQLEENPGAGASCSNGMLLDERKLGTLVGQLVENMTFDASKWILNNPAKMSAQVIYKIAAIKEVGGFDESFVNFCDGDMLLQLNKHHKALLLPISLCECHITSDDENYDYDCFRDGQKLYEKYLAHFLLNKDMALTFFQQMIRLAKTNYLWLNYGFYVILYFIKAPWHSTRLILQKFMMLLLYLIRWNRREFSLAKDYLWVNRDIRLLQRGKMNKLKSLNERITEGEISKPPVVFTSARHYNEYKPLDFVFDHKMQSIIIPDYVTVIRKDMFYGCDHLISVEIPNTVMEIQAHAFQRCKSLRFITIQEGSRLSKIGDYAFAGCSSLVTISLPTSIVQIGKYAFFECRSLRQLLFTYMHHGEKQTNSVFPTTIATVPRYAFAGCTNLITIEFGENSMLKSIETGAFLGCGKLREIMLTGRIETMASYAFAYCRELESLVIPQIDSVKSIGKGAFMYCEYLVYFQMPNQIERINIRTFYGCTRLKLVKIPKKVLSINHEAFAKCPLLVNAIILTGDISISPTAFDKHTRVQIQASADKDIVPGE